MFECKYCGSSDDISRKFKVCNSCIKLCVKDDERGFYVMDFSTWEKNKDEITNQKRNAIKIFN